MSACLHFPFAHHLFLPFLSPISPTMLCISSLLTDITLCNALFSLRIVVEAVSTKGMEDKASPCPFPPSSASFPLSLLLSIPPHLSSIFPHFSHFTSFASPLSFCHPVLGNVFLKISLILSRGISIFSSTVFTASVLKIPAYSCVQLDRKLSTF